MTKCKCNEQLKSSTITNHWTHSLPQSSHKVCSVDYNCCWCLGMRIWLDFQRTKSVLSNTTRNEPPLDTITVRLQRDARLRALSHSLNLAWPSSFDSSNSKQTLCCYLHTTLNSRVLQIICLDSVMFIKNGHTAPSNACPKSEIALKGRIISEAVFP